MFGIAAESMSVGIESLHVLVNIVCLQVVEVGDASRKCGGTVSNPISEESTSLATMVEDE